MADRRKKSQPSTGVADSKVERKRTQNRIAQQHAREKQIARVKELESIVDRIKSAAEDEDEGSDDASLMARNKKLTKSFMEVLDENAKLKQLLLRLRSNMITLSTQAAHGMSDAKYENPTSRVEQKEPSQGTESLDPSEATHARLQNSVYSTTSATLNSPHEKHDDHIFWDGTLGYNEGTMHNSASDSNRLTLVRTSCDSHQCLDAFSFSATEGVFPSSNHKAVQPVEPQPHAAESSHAFGSHLSSHEVMAHNILFKSNHPQPQVQGPVEGSIYQLYAQSAVALEDDYQITPAPFPQPTGSAHSVKSSSIFENLEEVLSLYISQREQLTDAMWRTLLSAAVRVLFSWTRLEEFASCLGLRGLHASIVRWRLEPTAENRDAIPSLFRPTDLQSVVINTTRYSPWLDVIPWPELRDQLLFRKDVIDAAEVLQDVLDNIVLELPHLGVAVLMSALFLATRKKILAPNLYDHENVHGDLDAIIDSGAFEVPMAIRTRFTPEELSMQPAAAIAQIKEEMDAQVGLRSMDSECHPALRTYTTPLNAGILRTLQVEFTEKYKVEEIEKWKLRPALGIKYPYLRTKNVQTRFPVVPASVLVGC